MTYDDLVNHVDTSSYAREMLINNYATMGYLLSDLIIYNDRIHIVKCAHCGYTSRKHLSNGKCLFDSGTWLPEYIRDPP